MAPSQSVCLPDSCLSSEQDARGPPQSKQNALWDEVPEILARRSKLSAEEIERQLIEHEWSLSAQEAMQHGFADRLDCKNCH